MDKRKEYLEALESGFFFKDKKVHGSLEAMIEYYSRRTAYFRIVYRAVGVLLIALSASIPIVNLVKTQIPHKELLVSAIATCLTVLSGVAAFFRWDHTWQSRTQCHDALLRQKAEWESKRSQALKEVDEAKGLLLLQEAQERLIANVYTIVESERSEFFKLQKPLKT